LQVGPILASNPGSILASGEGTLRSEDVHDVGVLATVHGFAAFSQTSEILLFRQS
jgi:hypothetical protein